MQQTNFQLLVALKGNSMKDKRKYLKCIYLVNVCFGGVCVCQVLSKPKGFSLKEANNLHQLDNICAFEFIRRLRAKDGKARALAPIQ